MREKPSGKGKNKKQATSERLRHWAKQNKPVVVEWDDSMSSSGWRDYEKSDMVCYTVGMLHKDEKDRVVIAQNKSAYGFGDYMEIPKVAIKKIKRLSI